MLPFVNIHTAIVKKYYYSCYITISWHSFLWLCYWRLLSKHGYTTILCTKGWTIHISSHIPDYFFVLTTSTNIHHFYLWILWKYIRILINWHLIFFQVYFVKVVKFIMFLCLTIMQNRIQNIMQSDFHGDIQQNS